MTKKHKLKSFGAIVGICALAFSHSAHAAQRPSLFTAGQSSTVLPTGDLLLTGGQSGEGDVRGDAYLVGKSGRPELLTSNLILPRTGHTATVLPNGKVLIFGGVDAAGKVVDTAEMFDPVDQSFSVLQDIKILPRAFHSATMLTDGTLLIAGGISAGGEMRSDVQTWDFRAGTSLSYSALLATPRENHTATLLPDGAVLITGGKDRSGEPARIDEIYDPETHRFSQTSAPEPATKASLALAASTPQDGASDAAIDSLIAVRFTSQADASSITAKNITLRASAGEIAISVVSAEEGRLAFVTPRATLKPGTDYTLAINGVADNGGSGLSPVYIRFRTAGQPQDTPDDEWIPDAKALAGNWNSGRGGSRWQNLPSLKAAPGITALAGQVLRLSGYPLENVSLEIDGNKTQSDRTGRFLLSKIAAGHHVLLIDGRTANRQNIAYGLFEAGVDIAPGRTNVLNYTIWMTKLDTADAVSIPSPTAAADTVITSPRLPGLQLHLPAKTVIMDHEGHPVHQLTITAIPLDKPPFPLPTGVRVPIYFTIQPGGSYVDVQTPGSGPKGGRLYYPNTYGAQPGTTFDFWNYDPHGKGWYVYGEGTVNQAGQSIVPNPGVVVYELTGAMVGSPNVAPASGPPPNNPKGKDGEPIDLSSGLFEYDQTDFTLPDVIPITLTRSYRTNDSRSRAFGIGASHQYDLFLVGNTSPYTYQELILPNGSRIRFDRTSPGTGYSDAVYMHSGTNTEYYGATIRWNAMGGWTLTTKTGTAYNFPESFNQSNPAAQAVIGISDRYGNTLTLTRSSYNLTKIASSNGRSIALQYDASNRITSATDNIGRTVSYTYDAGGRLATVTDANGGVTAYTYDSSNNLLTAKDARGIVYLTNQYDSYGRVIQQTLANGGTYLFAWTPSNNASQLYFANGGANNVSPTSSSFRYCSDCSKGYSALISQVDITDPRGYIRRVSFNSAGFTSSDVRAFGQPEQQTTTYQYFADNLVKAVTDPLGNTTSYDYDPNGNLATVTRLAGTSQAVTTTVTYAQPYNGIASVTDPLNHTTTFNYDTTGNLVGAIDPLGHQTAMAYNSAGQLTTLTDALGNVTLFDYFGADLFTVTDPLSNKTSRFADGAGRLVSTTDALGQTTSFQYDNLDQLTKTTDPLGNVTSMTYDPNGNLLSLTDPRGSVTTYTFDNMDNRVTRTDPLQRTESFQYDLFGNLLSRTDRKGTVTAYSYDSLNRRTVAGFNKVVNSGTATYESKISYTYDAGNRLLQASDSISGPIGYTYDGLGRLLTETTPQGALTYIYDAAGRRVTRSVTGQQDVTYSYDDGSRLTGIVQGTSQVGFAYDAGNRRSALTLPNGVTATYTYDSDSRLSTISYQSGGVSLGDLNYSYDRLGRRTQISGTLARTNLPNALASATYDAANELRDWNGASLTYDANGNLTSDGSRTFSWNARNQLDSIGGGTSASFQYDAVGRRTGKNIGGTSTSFLYDGPNATQENSGSANILTGGVDEIFQRTDSSGSFVPLVDGLGSILALVDPSGAVQTQYRFDPFGNTTVEGNLASNSAQYTGRENDGTGLYYYRARYYSPLVQRFIGEDPAGFSAGTNFYAYADNKPTSLIDPSGFAPGDKWWGFNNRDFQDWYHRVWNPDGPYDGDREDIEDAFKEWQDQGSPKRDRKSHRRNCKDKNRDPEQDPNLDGPDPSPESDPLSRIGNWVNDNRAVIIVGGAIAVGGIIILTGGAAAPLILAF